MKLSFTLHFSFSIKLLFALLIFNFSFTVQLLIHSWKLINYSSFIHCWSLFTLQLSLSVKLSFTVHFSFNVKLSFALLIFNFSLTVQPLIHSSTFINYSSFIHCWSLFTLQLSLNVKLSFILHFSFNVKLSFALLNFNISFTVQLLIHTWMFINCSSFIHCWTLFTVQLSFTVQPLIH